LGRIGRTDGGNRFVGCQRGTTLKPFLLLRLFDVAARRAHDAGGSDSLDVLATACGD
jgi:hypothetical protein